MTSFKKPFFLSIPVILIAILTFLFFSQYQNKPVFNPISDKNNFYNQLSLALKTSHFETSSWQVRDFLNQVEFSVNDENNNFKVILSDKKNPLWQIASLQEVIKTAKIKHQPLKLVDLSAAHPYATFKNN